jgi:hypothetical protein
MTPSATGFLGLPIMDTIARRLSMVPEDTSNQKKKRRRKADPNARLKL